MSAKTGPQATSRTEAQEAEMDVVIGSVLLVLQR
jgi:hypothetical protein